MSEKSTGLPPHTYMCFITSQKSVVRYSIGLERQSPNQSPPNPKCFSLTLYKSSNGDLPKPIWPSPWQSWVLGPSTKTAPGGFTCTRIHQMHLVWVLIQPCYTPNKSQSDTVIQSSLHTQIGQSPRIVGEHWKQRRSNPFFISVTSPPKSLSSPSTTSYQIFFLQNTKDGHLVLNPSQWLHDDVFPCPLCPKNNLQYLRT